MQLAPTHTPREPQSYGFVLVSPSWCGWASWTPCLKGRKTCHPRVAAVGHGNTPKYSVELVLKIAVGHGNTPRYSVEPILQLAEGHCITPKYSTKHMHTVSVVKACLCRPSIQESSQRRTATPKIFC